MLDLHSLVTRFGAEVSSKPRPVAEFKIGGRPFRFNERAHLMGVINLSSDSWYRESVCLSTEQAIRRGATLLAQGADIIDIGAESTLAHAERVDEALQKTRLLPIVTELRNLGAVISVETYEPEVAKAALDAGASVINLTGPKNAEEIYRIAGERKAAVIICYVQGDHVRDVADFVFHEDPLAAHREFFAREIDRAKGCGLESILIDPGLGFYYRNLQDSAVRIRHQMSVFLGTFRLRELRAPVCHALPHAFETFGEEVRTSESFFAVLAALGGTSLFRTHEVSKVKAVLDTMALWDAFGR